MSIIKLAATKWKHMVSSLNDDSIKRLKNIIPTKKRYIAGMEKGILNRRKALENKYNIKIHNQAKNSKTISAFGMKVSIPLPIATVPLDSKNYVIVHPKNYKRNIVNLGNLNSLKDQKILDLYTKQHELSEISQMAKHVKKLKPQLTSEKIISKAAKNLNSLEEKDLLTLNPHGLSPNYHSHFNKKVLNFDNRFMNKVPYSKIKNTIKNFRIANDAN